MAQPERSREIIADHYARNDPLGWFEALYAEADGSTKLIPWADQKSNPHLVRWLDRERIDGAGRSAMVVGCGLGDDAEELARRGFDVTAFDISPSAIAWCKERFASSPVKYEQADLLNLPARWIGAFDFVFESYTLQALPRSLRPRAIQGVAALVKPGGQLLVVCRGREENEDEGSLPWPLTHADIAAIEANGLTRVSFENFFDTERGGDPIRRFRVLFQKG